MTPEEIFLDNLPLIEKIMEHACRRHHLSREEAQDFASWARIRLIEDNYAILRKFKGQSSLGFYLTVVIQRLMLDYLNHIWGKWRPCTEAKRLGPVAIRLDILRNRDGYSFDQAYQILRTNHHVEMSWQELEKLDARLPSRPLRINEGEEALEDLADENEWADGLALSTENARAWRKVEICLRKALGALSAQDRLIIKMRMWSDISVVGISRTLRMEQKPLYRRIEKIQKTLREAMERDGIRAEDVNEILNSPEH